VVGSVESVESLSDYDGLEVEVTGYFIGLASSKYFTIILSDITASSTPFLRISPEGTTTVSCSTTSLGIKVSGNVDWTANSDNADFQLDATSGQGNATINVSFPANTDPDNAKTATITVSSELGNKTLTITQKKYAPITNFEKVTSDLKDWKGTYLIVYEDGSLAFDGSLTSDVAKNSVGVTITGTSIEATDELLAKSVTVDAVTGGYSIKTASGKYILGGTASQKNVINYTDSASGAITFSVSDGVATITSDNGGETSTLQYNPGNKTTDPRFRFYKKLSQKVPQLYKLAE